MKLWNVGIYTAFLSGILSQENTFSAGIGFEYQSVRSSARGNAFVATSDSAALLHYNPGGVAFLNESVFEAHVFGIYGELSYEDSGRSFEGEDTILATAAVYYAQPFVVKDRQYVWGIGLNAPYGQSFSWPSDISFRNSGYQASMLYRQLNFTLASEVSRGLGIGLSVIVAQSDIESRSGVALPTDTLVFEGNDLAVGYQLGVHYQLNSHWHFGLSYRSGIKLKHDGKFTYTSGSSLVPGFEEKGAFAFDLPQHIVLGFEYSPNERVSIGAQVQWTEWDSIDSFDSEVSGVTQRQIVNWSSSFIYSFGVSWQCAENTTVHAGYMYVEPLIDDKYRLPLVVDFEQHFISLGITRRVNDWVFDAAIIGIISNEDDLRGSIYDADGTYENVGYFVNLGITRVF